MDSVLIRIGRFLLRIGAAILTFLAFVSSMLGMAYSTGRRWEEGEVMNDLDVLINGVVPGVALIALLIAWWKPIPGGVVAMLLSPLLLIETPVMYGAPSPYWAVFFGAAGLCHVLIGVTRRSRSAVKQ